MWRKEGRREEGENEKRDAGLKRNAVDKHTNNPMAPPASLAIFINKVRRTGKLQPLLEFRVATKRFETRVFPRKGKKASRMEGAVDDG